MDNYEEDNIVYDFDNDILLNMEDKFFENNKDSYFEESYINDHESDNEYSSSEFVFEAPFSTTYSDYEIDDITTDTKSSSMEVINDNQETWNEPVDLESIDVEKEFGPFTESEMKSIQFLRKINTRIEELKQEENNELSKESSLKQEESDEISKEPSSKRTHFI